MKKFFFLNCSYSLIATFFASPSGCILNKKNLDMTDQSLTPLSITSQDLKKSFNLEIFLPSTEILVEIASKSKAVNPILSFLSDLILDANIRSLSVSNSEKITWYQYLKLPIIDLLSTLSIYSSQFL